MMRPHLQGQPELRQFIRRLIAAMRPGGSMTRIITYATDWGRQLAGEYSHQDTTELSKSHLSEVTEGGSQGRVYINPSAVNPRGQRPAIYGPFEHGHGTSHAFYTLTSEDLNESLPGIMARVVHEDIGQ